MKKAKKVWSTPEQSSLLPATRGDLPINRTAPGTTQENYIQTVLDVVLPGKRLGIAGEQIADEVSALYTQYNRSKKTNMMYLKRIVERVVFKRYR